MKKLLITGFEPFGGEEINPSWEAISRLPERINEYTLFKLRIPVEFGKAAECVLQEAEEIRPDVILCIGQAGGRGAITPELVAINLRYAKIPDNAGYQPMDEAIIKGGARAYFPRSPCAKWQRRLRLWELHRRSPIPPARTFATICFTPYSPTLREAKRVWDLYTFRIAESKKKSLVWSFLT